MVDTNTFGCNWIELPAGSYQIREESDKNQLDHLYKVSRCQLEVDVAYDKFISHKPEGKVLLSFLFKKSTISFHPELDLIIQVLFLYKHPR